MSEWRRSKLSEEGEWQLILQVCPVLAVLCLTCQLTACYRSPGGVTPLLLSHPRLLAHLPSFSSFLFLLLLLLLSSFPHLHLFRAFLWSTDSENVLCLITANGNFTRDDVANLLRFTYISSKDTVGQCSCIGLACGVQRRFIFMHTVGVAAIQ